MTKENVSDKMQHDLIFSGCVVARDEGLLHFRLFRINDGPELTEMQFLQVGQEILDMEASQ